MEIEADGGIHDDPEQIERDLHRLDYMKEHGVRVLRFANAEIENHLDQVLEKILAETRSPRS